MTQLICIAVVPRHQGRIVFLEYQGEGTVEKTLFLVGKVRLLLGTKYVIHLHKELTSGLQCLHH